MSFRVFWAPYAEQQLEQILRRSVDQTRLVEAAYAIDQRLAKEPLAFGESRYDTVRIAFERPLAIQYEVLEDVATVIVYDVWQIDVKRQD